MPNLGFFGEPFFMENPAKLNDPFADLALYREECPVYYNPPLQQWFLFRYDDVASIFSDPRISADRMKGLVDEAPEAVRHGLRELAPSFRSWVMMVDNPDHARIRKFLNLGFNATVVEKLAPAIERSCRELLDRVPADGRFDAGADYSFLLPAYVLSDFLGVRVEDRGKILQWSLNFVDFFNVFPITVDSAERMIRSAKELNSYVMALLEERRTHPHNDFLGTLAQANPSGDGLTSEEIAGNAMLLLLAGHIAVRNLIGNAIYLLLTCTGAQEKFDQSPAMLRNLVEESLRFDPPVALIPRIALADIPLEGSVVPKGAVIQLSLAAANRDPRHFSDPDRFDITRFPERILSFGHGPHGCLGAHLARMQGEVALRELFRRFHNLRLDPERPVEWYRTSGSRGPVHLPLIVS